MNEDETLDLVNIKDQVIGTILRSQYDEMVAKNLGYIRAADIFIVNNQGELWIPRRRKHKKIAPGGLDFSAGEHVKSLETYDEAAIRGLSEELNIQAKIEQLKPITKMKPIAGMPLYFSKLYMFRHNEAPHYNKEDFSEYFWLKPAELLRLLNNGEPAKVNLPRAVQFIHDWLEKHS